MSLEAQPSALARLVGPEASPAQQDAALRQPGGTHYTGWQRAPHAGPCTVDADAYTWCSRIPAGGVARCAEPGCRRWVFIPPETCLERLEPVAAETVVDLSARRAA